MTMNSEGLVSQQEKRFELQLPRRYNALLSALAAGPLISILKSFEGLVEGAWPEAGNLRKTTVCSL